MLKEQKDEHLMIQCEACEETMAEGKEELTRLFGGVDMGSHQEVFATFFNKTNSFVPLPPGHSRLYQMLKRLEEIPQRVTL
ncbi:hypothetical protein Z043-109612 [Arapaima gigas]